MLQETTENDSVVEGLIASVNEIESESESVRMLPPAMEDVDLEKNTKYYVPAVIDDASPPRKMWLRPTLTVIGALLLVGVIAFVGVMMWDPIAFKRGKTTSAMATLTTIEIDVWDGEESDSVEKKDDIMESTLNSIRKEQSKTDELSIEAIIDKAPAKYYDKPLSQKDMKQIVEKSRARFADTASPEQIVKHFGEPSE